MGIEELDGLTRRAGKLVRGAALVLLVLLAFLALGWLLGSTCGCHVHLVTLETPKCRNAEMPQQATGHGQQTTGNGQEATESGPDNRQSSIVNRQSPEAILEESIDVLVEEALQGAGQP